MNIEQYEKLRDRIRRLVEGRLSDEQVSASEKNDLKTLLQILNRYTYTNRLFEKGLLSRVIVDGLNIDMSLAGEIITFDQLIR